MNRSYSVMVSFLAIFSFYQKLKLNLNWSNSKHLREFFRHAEYILSLPSSLLSKLKDFVYSNNSHQPLLTTQLRASITNYCDLRILNFTARSRFKSLSVILVFITTFLPSANATDYYVDTKGNDTNKGTLSSPWKSISKAAKTLVAGDTVYIRAGTYKEQVTPQNSGSALNGFITYTAYPNETVTLDGSNGLNWNWNGIFDLSNRSYIQISGLRVINSAGFGFFMLNSSNVKILNNYTYSTQYSGIYNEDSDSITIDGNEVELANKDGGSQESISIASGTNFIVSNNRVHGGGKEGIDAKGSVDNGKIFGNIIYDMARVGIYIDAWDSLSNNIEIYNNIVSDSKSQDSGASEDGIRIGAEHGGVISNAKIYNNIVHKIAASAIVLSNWKESGFKEPTFKNISILNNTTYNCGTRDSSYGGGIDIQGASATGIIIQNNILSQNRNFPIRLSTGIPSANVTISNNLIEKSGGTQASNSSTGVNAVIGRPLFTDPAVNDFHLQSTSPAINSGLSTGAPDKDFDLHSRPQGGQVDIGAFEYGSSSNTSKNSADVTPPSAPLNLTSSISSSMTVQLSWDASSDNVGVTGYKIYRDNVGIGSTGETNFVDTSVAEGSTYAYVVKAYDAANNYSDASNTVKVQTPQKKINITSSSVGTISATAATVSWTTNVPSTGTVSFGISADKLSANVTDNTQRTSHSIRLTGLTRRTSYFYQIKTKDSSNNIILSPVYNFRTTR